MKFHFKNSSKAKRDHGWTDRISGDVVRLRYINSTPLDLGPDAFNPLFPSFWTAAFHQDLTSNHSLFRNSRKELCEGRCNQKIQKEGGTLLLLLNEAILTTFPFPNLFFNLQFSEVKFYAVTQQFEYILVRKELVNIPCLWPPFLPLFRSCWFCLCGKCACKINKWWWD